MVVKTCFLIKDDEVRDEYDKIWDMIKNKLGIKFHSKPVYKQKYIKAKVMIYQKKICIIYLHCLHNY